MLPPGWVQSGDFPNSVRNTTRLAYDSKRVTRSSALRRKEWSMDPGRGVPSDLHAWAERWRAAEDAVYPLAVTDSDAYQQAVQLVGLLRPYFDTEAVQASDLPDVAGRAGAVLRSLAAREGLSTAGLDADALVGCAAAARLRTLLVSIDAGTEDAALESARAAGLRWAVVQEPDLTLAGMGLAQQWVEVHVESRARLVRGIAMQPATGEALFSIEVLAPGDSRPSLRLELDSRQEWLEEAEEMRKAFDELGAGK